MTVSQEKYIMDKLTKIKLYFSAILYIYGGIFNVLFGGYYLFATYIQIIITRNTIQDTDWRFVVLILLIIVILILSLVEILFGILLFISGIFIFLKKKWTFCIIIGLFDLFLLLFNLFLYVITLILIFDIISLLFFYIFLVAFIFQLIGVIYLFTLKKVFKNKYQRVIMDTS
jgi:hypothetical protein